MVVCQIWLFMCIIYGLKTTPNIRHNQITHLDILMSYFDKRIRKTHCHSHNHNQVNMVMIDINPFLIMYKRRRTINTVFVFVLHLLRYNIYSKMFPNACTFNVCFYYYNHLSSISSLTHNIEPLNVI